MLIAVFENQLDHLKLNFVNIEEGEVENTFYISREEKEKIDITKEMLVVMDIVLEFRPEKIIFAKDVLEKDAHKKKFLEIAERANLLIEENGSIDYKNFTEKDFFQPRIFKK